MTKEKEENERRRNDHDQGIHDVGEHERVPERKDSYHETNVKIYFSNPVGIGEHPDIMAAIEEELEKVAESIKKSCKYYRRCKESYGR